MPAETQSSGCEVVLMGGCSGDCCVLVYCSTHNTTENVDTPSEAWAWEQEHRRSVAAEGEIPRVGTLVEPNV